MSTTLLALILFLQAPGPIQNQNGLVTGQLLSDAGGPAKGIRVTAMVVPEPGDPTDDVAILVSLSQTDSEGRYRLENVPPGRYYITAGQVDFPTYYPGVAGADGARIVTVAAGASIESIDFAMMRAVAVKVSGRVILESNQMRQANQSVRLVNGSPGQNFTSAIAANGTFEFPSVRPGNYQIAVIPLNGLQPQRVTVGERDLQFDLVLPVTVSINGVISVEGGGLLPRLTVEFSGTGNGPAAYRASGAARPDGRITAIVPPGEYRLAATGLPGGYYLKAITSGSIDLVKEPLKVSSTDSPSIVVEIGVSSPPPWVKFSGRVVGLPSMTAATSTLRLSNPGAAANLQSSIKGDGSFEFPMVLPGTYNLGLVPNLSMPPVSVVVPEGRGDIAGVEIAFPAVREITGRIVVEGNSPVPRIQLILNGSVGRVRLSLTPDSDGRFRVTAPEGEHTITLNLPPEGYILKSLTYGATDLLTQPLKISRTDAAELQIIYSPSKTSAWVKVSGVVTGFPNTPGAALPMVTITPAPSSATSDVTIKPDGTFEFPQVLPGTYRLRARAGSGLANAVIVVGASGLTGVELKFPRQVSVRGSAAMEGNGPLPRIALQLSAASSTSTVSANPRPDGTFSLTLPEGEYAAVFNSNTLPPGYVVSALTYGAANLLSEPLKVSAADPADFRVTFRTTGSVRTVKVSGRVVNGSPGASVALTGVSSQLRSATVGADGSFEFQEVLPGTYTIRTQPLPNPRLAQAAVAISLTVGGADIANVQLEIPLQKEVTVRVTTEGGGVIPGFVFQLTNATGIARSRNTTPVDGTFKVFLPMDARQVELLNLPAGYSVKSLTYGSTNLVTDLLKISDTDTAEILVTLTGK